MQYSAMAISPGRMPAMKSDATSVSVRIAYRMNITDGGIMMPSVPPAATTPAERPGS